MNVNHQFAQFANWIARAAGSQWTFTGAVAIVLAWLVAGIFIGYDNTLYQLTINTTSSIITLLMVFVVQNSQNRDGDAIHLKLDELILKMNEADNTVIGSEVWTEDELNQARAAVIAQAAAESETTQQLAQQER